MYPSLAALLKYFEPGDVVVDVGAHHGLFSIEFARRGAKVIAVEPHSQNLVELHKAIEAAGVSVHVVPVALSARTGSAPLYNGGPSTVHSLVPDLALKLFGHLQPPDLPPPETVPIMRWSDFCRSCSIAQVDILKLDAKWHDLAVLQGVVVAGSPWPRIMMVELLASERAAVIEMAGLIGMGLVETIGLDGERDTHDGIFVRGAP